MIIFLLGLFIFLGIHCISIPGDSWRNRIAGTIGEGTWKVLYSLASIFGFALLAWGYGIARHGSPDLYTPSPWLHHLSFVLLLPVFPLLIAAYFPGRIKSAVHHPMLLATLLWAAGHLLCSGSLINVILFGSFLIWAALVLLSLQHRQRRSTPAAPSFRYNDAFAVVIGLTFHLAFSLGFHQLLFGVSPL